MVAGARSAEAETVLRTAGLNVLRAFEEMKFGGQYVSRLTLFGGLSDQLEYKLIEREVAALSEEIPDHDIAERWERVSSLIL